MNIESFLKKTKLFPCWKSIGIKPHHGINTPIGALKSKNSSGIGEFFDLILLIDFCHEIGFDIIQILPINDSGEDPSPYNALSSMALHPIYLSLKNLPYIHHYKNLLDQLSSFAELNHTKKIEYHSVLTKKLDFLKEYESYVGEILYMSEEFNDFLALNSWVREYALYKSLKTLVLESSWESWPETLKNPTYEQKKELFKIHEKEVLFFSLLQFLCYKQMSHVKHYAEKKGVFLKGDIPILISPDSADVWLHREYFNTNVQVGYPPDIYNGEGQLWGFPALNWEILSRSHFSWWGDRLRVASIYYHLYRLDHVAGFYRLWLIDKGKKPIDGAYVPENLDEAIEAGHSYLSTIPLFSTMLPIAEDLGNIPEQMRQSLKELGICGTRVMRWEREWESDGLFIDPSAFDPLTMSCVSTHDSETLGQWWRNYPDEANVLCDQLGWNYNPTLEQTQRYDLLMMCHMTRSLFHINLLGEYLALIEEFVQDDLDAERINIPGFVLSTNWTYRMRPTLEQMKKNEPLKKMMRDFTKGA